MYVLHIIHSFQFVETSKLRDVRIRTTPKRQQLRCLQIPDNPAKPKVKHNRCCFWELNNAVLKNIYVID